MLTFKINLLFFIIIIDQSYNQNISATIAKKKKINNNKLNKNIYTKAKTL